MEMILGGETNSLLPFDGFRNLMRNEFGLSELPGPSQRLIADLEFDSIRMLELICVIEDLGAYVPDEALSTLETVEDAYAAYNNWYGTAGPDLGPFEGG